MAFKKDSPLRNAGIIAVLAVSLALLVPVHGEEDASKPLRPLILDMVHHNPGEPLYDSDVTGSYNNQQGIFRSDDMGTTTQSQRQDQTFEVANIYAVYTDQ